MITILDMSARILRCAAASRGRQDGVPNVYYDFAKIAYNKQFVNPRSLRSARRHRQIGERVERRRRRLCARELLRLVALGVRLALD